ncbi:DUF6114 domain-containing protein [Glaciihabitans sp. GrIS 2.15]|uniref:DUF6114 domain-containing protein n=1 Tax=Glaciihabitans sp. GrIS 2.15 TaxID=3071710 RepID=UPI002E0C865E|nr:putative membrane protein [Glaciihabitans sp. GrIS 2.15]
MASSRLAMFPAWRCQRPFVGGILAALAGMEMFFSGQLDVGNIHVQVGIEGLQATIIPVLMVLLGILAMLMPVHRIFYGVIVLVLSVYSLIGVNLGGFFIGMLLGAIGGILIVAWMPKKAAHATSQEPAEAPADPAPVEPAPLVPGRS